MPKVTTACAVTAIKYLTHALGPLLGLISPWTLVAVISFVISFYASARSLQLGLAVEVIAVTSVAANLAAILGEFLCSESPSARAPSASPPVCSRSALSSPAPRSCWFWGGEESGFGSAVGSVGEIAPPVRGAFGL